MLVPFPCGTQRRRRANGFFGIEKGTLVSGAKWSAMGTRGTDDVVCGGFKGLPKKLDSLTSGVGSGIGRGGSSAEPEVDCT